LSSRVASSDGSSSSNIDSSIQQQHIADIIEVLLLLIRPAVTLGGNTKSGEAGSATAWCRFLTNPAVTEFVVQLLGLRCLLMHKQHVQYQQQQQQQQGQALRQQLGKRMHGDLLQLADPRNQLLPLLPSIEFLAADAATLAAGDSSFGVNDVIWGLKALGNSNSTSIVTRSRSHPSQSAAALLLSSQLLLLAAAFWQQNYHSFIVIKLPN
jgi:hypothetical protein